MMDQVDSILHQAEEVQEEKTKNEYIMPFAYRDDEHYYVESLGEIPKKPIYSFLKRIGDILFSFFGMVVMLLPMAVIAICVKATSKGPVFYFQERLGLHGKSFRLIKFRTMVQDAEKVYLEVCESLSTEQKLAVEEYIAAIEHLGDRAMVLAYVLGKNDK